MVVLEALVVADAGPIIALSFVDRIGLLKELFTRVVVPPAVWNEATRDAGAPGASEILAATFIEILSPSSTRPHTALPATLGPGEVEAIALAEEFPAAVLLLDDRRARIAATSLGLHVSGTVGILVRAKRSGLIEHIRPLIEDLRGKGIRYSDKLVAEALAAVEEA